MKKWIVLAFTTCTSVCFGGLGLITGKEASTFTEDRTSVIIARIITSRLTAAPSEPSLREVELEPVATLAGQFDATTRSQLLARVYVGSSGTSVKSPLPADKTFVIAVIRTRTPEDESRGASAVVVSAACTFMPDYTSLAPITGLDDPKILAVVQSLRDRRNSPATNPAATP